MDPNDILSLTGGLPPAEFNLYSNFYSNLQDEGVFSHIHKDPDQTGVPPNVELQNVPLHKGPDFFGAPFDFNSDHFGELLNPGTNETSASGLIWEFPMEDISTAKQNLPDMGFMGLEDSQYTGPVLSPIPATTSPTAEPSTSMVLPTSTSVGKKIRIRKAARDLMSAVFTSTPYPSNEQIAGLAIETALTGKQVRTWFTNQRSRSNISGRYKYAFFLFSVFQLASISLLVVEKLTYLQEPLQNCCAGVSNPWMNNSTL
jgi:hypothetical protein